MAVSGPLAAFASLMSAGVVAGCAAAASASPPPTTPPSMPTVSAALSASPSPSPVAQATPSPTPVRTPDLITAPPGPAVVGPVTLVKGTLTCTDAGGGTETTGPNGAGHFRGGRFKCTEDTDDPRVNGASEYAINLDTWERGGAGALTQWGAVDIKNDKGAWHGVYTGVADTDKGDTIVVWYVGTGAYKGLSYFELVTGFGPWEIRGQVFPGVPPKP